MTDTVRVPREEWVDYLAMALDKAPSAIRRALINLEAYPYLRHYVANTPNPVMSTSRKGV